TGLGTTHVGKMISVVATSAARDLSGNPLVDFVTKFQLAPAQDSRRPVVQSVRPTNGAGNVPPGKSWVVFYNEPIDLSSAESAVRVSVNGSLVDGDVSLEAGGHILEFTPDSPFGYDSLVQIFIDRSLTDRNGVPMSSNYSAMFMTESDPSSRAATLVSLFPTSQPARNASFLALLSEPMDPDSLDETTVLVRNLSQGGAPAVVGQRELLLGDRLFKFTPNESLPASNRIRFEFLDTFLAADGGGMTRRTIDVFPRDEEDTDAGTWTSTAPRDGDTGVQSDSRISLRASEDLNPLSANEGTVSIAGPAGAAISCSILASGSLLNVTPHEALQDNSAYRVIVDGVTDAAGNAFPRIEFNFDTGSVPEFSRAVVVRTSPLTQATGVGRNPQISVEFDQQIAGPSILPGSFYLLNLDSSQFVDTTASLDATGRVLSLELAGALDPDTRYRIFASSSLVDYAGVAASGRSTDFTTGPDEDNTPPSVSVASPDAGTVPTNVRFYIDANEALNYLTVTTANVVVEESGGAAVPASVTLDSNGRRIVVVPLMPLAALTAHELTLTNVEDLCGNVLAPYSVDVTTGAGADFTRPALASSNPATNTTGVSRVGPFVLTLNERISATSVNPANVGISGFAANVSLDASGTQITITPAEQLPALRVLTIFANVHDLAGNTDTFSSIRLTTGE
ncbi:MAG: Ig-like domain-containing protein, partial [Planctomycetota bacterium]